jgi:antitoxin component of MazEF toxin-antitoxin module
MIVRVKNKPPVVIPPAALRRAGFKSGQDLEVKASGGVITILPKFPNADDEYTPEQRRIVDAQLADGLADIKAGRTFGPFETADEMIAHMKAPVVESPGIKSPVRANPATKKVNRPR